MKAKQLLCLCNMASMCILASSILIILHKAVLVRYRHKSYLLRAPIKKIATKGFAAIFWNKFNSNSWIWLLKREIIWFHFVTVTKIPLFINHFCFCLRHITAGTSLIYQHIRICIGILLNVNDEWERTGNAANLMILDLFSFGCAFFLNFIVANKSFAAFFCFFITNSCFFHFISSFLLVNLC